MRDTGEGHDWRTCGAADCEECQALVDEGVLIACDECGEPGENDAGGWTMTSGGLVLCAGCADEVAT